MAGKAFGGVRESREPVEEQVQGGGGAAHPDVGGLAVEFGSQPGRAHQVEEGAARVEVRHDAAGLDLFAAGKQYTGGRPVLHQDPFDFGVGADLGAVRLSCGGQSLGELADTAFQEGR